LPHKAPKEQEKPDLNDAPMASMGAECGEEYPGRGLRRGLYMPLPKKKF